MGDGAARAEPPAQLLGHAEVPSRVEYEISDLGRSLAPLFATLATWSADNLPKVGQARLDYDGEAAPTGPR